MICKLAVQILIFTLLKSGLRIKNTEKCNEFIPKNQYFLVQCGFLNPQYYFQRKTNLKLII